MRVPSVGLTLEDRRHLRAIVREGYAHAERLLADYRDPPGPLAQWVAAFRHWVVVR